MSCQLTLDELNIKICSFLWATLMINFWLMSQFLPCFFVFRGNGNRNIGVVMNEGPKWEVNRKLMIRELKGRI